MSVVHIYDAATVQMQSSEVQGGMRSSSTTLTFGAMKGEKTTKSTNSKFCNPGYVLDTECQCL